MTEHKPSSGSRALTPGRAAIVLALTILIMGTNWPTLKIATRSIDPLWFNVIRMLGASIVFTVFLAARGKLILPTRRDMPMVLGLGLMQFGVMSSMVAFGVSEVGAGRSSILVYTNSIWVTVGAILFLGERPSRTQIFSMVCGLTGIAILFSPFDIDWSSRRVMIGNGAVVLGSMVWSAALLQVRGHRWHADPIELMPLQTLLGALLTLPFAVAFEGVVPTIHWSWAFVLSMTVVVVLATCVAFWGLAVAGRSLPAIVVSLAQPATPVIAVSCAAALVGEIPTWADLAGLSLIVLGVAVAALFGRSRMARPRTA